MFLNFLKPNIAFGSEGSSSGGGDSGGGSSSSKSTTPKKKKTTTSSKVGTDAGDGMVWAKSKNSNALVRVKKSSGGGGGRNLDADMAAGSNYAKTKDAGTGAARQVTYTNDTDGPKRKEVALTKKTPIQSKTSVTAKDLKEGKVTTYKSKKGTGSVTVARGTKLKDVPTVNVGVDGKKTKPNTEVYDPVGSTPNKKNPVSGTTGGSSDPVTAPEKISPQDGVGGGRDGGGSAKRKASKVEEDNLKVKRQAQGVDKYKNRQQASIRKAGEKRRKNSMKITRRA